MCDYLPTLANILEHDKRTNAAKAEIARAFECVRPNAERLSVLFSQDTSNFTYGQVKHHLRDIEKEVGEFYYSLGLEMSRISKAYNFLSFNMSSPVPNISYSSDITHSSFGTLPFGRIVSVDQIRELCDGKILGLPIKPQASLSNLIRKAWPINDSYYTGKLFVALSDRIKKHLCHAIGEESFDDFRLWNATNKKKVDIFGCTAKTLPVWAWNYWLDSIRDTVVVADADAEVCFGMLDEVRQAIISAQTAVKNFKAPAGNDSASAILNFTKKQCEAVNNVFFDTLARMVDSKLIKMSD